MSEFTRDMVREWCKSTTGQFHYKQILDGRINVKRNPNVFDKLRADVDALCKEEVIEPVGKKDGYYRLVQEIPNPIEWQGVETKRDFPIILPFDLRRYIWIDPDTSIVVAGSKDSGKTGFLMRTVALNMNNIRTVFLTNLEGGVNQMKRRFDAMDIPIPTPAPFIVHHMIDNFHDAIREPDTLYVIDYIDVPETGEFFMIAPALAKIQIRLKNSVAVVGLQKRKNSDTAYGGEQTLKKAGLYIAMDNGKLKIVSAKRATNPKVIPKNMTWTFQYDQEGTNFLNITPSYESE